MPTASLCHPHTAGHLGPGGLPRCGCARPLSNPVSLPRPAVDGRGWSPLRRQHVGFVRAHFIYSDRMGCLGA